MSQRQRQIVEEFERRARLGEAPPTYRELCRVFGWSSSASARDHLRSLAKKGILVHAEGKARGYQLAKPMKARVLLVGVVVAGAPEFAEEQVVEHVSVPASWVGNQRTFALRVRGDSMKDAGIVEGDIVVVQGDREAVSGDIVAATIDNETTLKTLKRDRQGRFWLHPENAAFEPILIDDVNTTIHGVVFGLLRAYRQTQLGGQR
jgi:repressor LexA